MWTTENRPRYNRDWLRYPSDLTDEEWTLVEPLIPPGKPGGGKRRVNLREVVNGVMYILSTGCQWRYVSGGGRMATLCAAPSTGSEDCTALTGIPPAGMGTGQCADPP